MNKQIRFKGQYIRESWMVCAAGVIEAWDYLRQAGLSDDQIEKMFDLIRRQASWMRTMRKMRQMV